MNIKNIIVITGILISVVVIGYWGYTKYSSNKVQPEPVKEATETEYNPDINPDDFTTSIDNKYLRLPVGRKLYYEEQTADGLENIIIEIEPGTKKIMGVTTIIYRDTVSVDGVLVEDTRDYLAQDKDGNVWYFGEDVDNYENGTLQDHSGSWVAGVDGAEPGIWIKAENKAGDSYKQEYFKGEAEDMRDVVAVNQTVVTKAKTYTDCVKMYDWTPLAPDAKEYKYYCPEVAAEVVTENAETNEIAELVKIEEPGN